MPARPPEWQAPNGDSGPASAKAPARLLACPARRNCSEGASPGMTNWLCLDAALNQDALGAVVPDVHLHDLAVLHHEAVDIAVALERRAVDPLAIERADAVDHGLAI